MRSQHYLQEKRHETWAEQRIRTRKCHKYYSNLLQNYKQINKTFLTSIYYIFISSTLHLDTIVYTSNHNELGSKKRFSTHRIIHEYYALTKHDCAFMLSFKNNYKLNRNALNQGRLKCQTTQHLKQGSETDEKLWNQSRNWGSYCIIRRTVVFWYGRCDFYQAFENLIWNWPK